MKFNYQAFDSKGAATRGDIDASSEAEATDLLRRRDLFVSEIVGATDFEASGASGGSMAGGKRLRNLAMFSRQMHVLISSGTPLVQALSAVERQVEEQRWQGVIKSIRETVEQGTPISEAMRRFPSVFDAVCLSLMSAGEASGDMPAMLDRMATLARKQLKLRTMIMGALVYPCLLIVMGTVVMLTMLMFVLPRFSDLFAQLDAPLPPTTKFLLWISGMLWNDWWIIGPVLLAIVFGGYWWITRGHGRPAIDAALVRVPKVGKIFRSLMTARLARILGVLLESRVPLLTALRLSRESVVHAQYNQLMLTAETAVERGEPMSSVLSTSDLIAAPVQEAIRTGELSGKLGMPLVQMADFLDEENDIIIKTLTSLIEPAILIVLGVLVGFVAMSVFLPLFDLVSAAHGGAH